MYTLSPHTGRGGWTWYSGSAGWMYQLITDSILGIRLSGNKLSFEPCIPEEWESFKINYRFGSSVYKIVVQQKSESGKTSVKLDNVLQDEEFLNLMDDNSEHNVEVVIFKIKHIYVNEKV